MPRARVKGPDQVDELFVFVNGKKTTVPKDLWLIDELCHCRRWGYLDFKSLTAAEGKMQDPPKCSHCHKYQNRMMVCAQCRQWFYMWFKHSRQGWHTTPKVGFYCWNCCERYYPPVVEPNAIKRFGFVQPPRSILPPGHELYVRER